jgi:acyl carrier protein
MIEKKLEKIFSNLFELKIAEAKNSKMSNTNQWDSFSHINLIIELEKSFKIKKINSSEIAKLNSFQNCANYLKKNLKKKLV